MVRFRMNGEGGANRIDRGSDMRCEKKIGVREASRFGAQTVGRMRLP